MPSDSELRRRFREGTQPRDQIDVDAVLRRVRARRRPRVAIAAAGSVLAIAAIAVPAAIVTSMPTATSTDSALIAQAPEAESGAADSDAAMSRAPAEKLNRCAAPVAEVAPLANGLVITAEPVIAAATDRSIPVTVTLTNGGTESLLGTTGSRPALTLSRDGVTLWHTNGPSDMMARIVDLGPGESMTYQTTFEPLVCGAADESLEAFPADLPPAGPGTYQLSAAIDLSHDDGSALDLVTGPVVDVILT